jgi:uncharacterized membrane protein YheB (UPF0754 family)
MKKLITIPNRIHDILEEHKKLTGRSITSLVQEAIYKWMIHEKLLTQRRVKLFFDEKTGIILTEEQYKDLENGKDKKISEFPEAIKYCDGDKCEIL